MKASTEEKLMKIGKRYKTRKEFRQAEKGFYDRCSQAGLLDLIFIDRKWLGYESPQFLYDRLQAGIEANKKKTKTKTKKKA